MSEEQLSGGRIVVGVDGSEESKAALRWAAYLSRTSGMSVDALCAWEFPTLYGGPVYLEELRPDLDAETILKETLDEVFPDGRPDGLRALPREGQARAVLLDASHDAAMLVVGSRGHGGFTGMLLGSVSSACVQHAACAVLIARGNPPT